MSEPKEGRISFWICGIPIPILEEFKEFCKDECANDYSMGLKILLERNRIGFVQELTLSRLRELEEKIDKPVEKKEEKPKRMTFGSSIKNEVKKDEQTIKAISEA